ncbi:TPA: hypothetical protein QHU19_004179 [Klebsiella aerogenes]|uniref:DUF6246 family protein n=1 Tax=Klebsiella aerogenes TaxID=548 RepID=UPI0006684899|nr:DUF6246 family protein [Klebsiella aerogenes]EKU4980272.1 hypothetical protein [Klebsiella aerogenes]ELA2172319.1 hypothetical protein [Klebsiella aerogenes]RSW97471.1 hypothetical protein EGH42_08885 [Klebsiella aerogenes]WBN59346.1 hypothetical protein KHW00_19590 [Klebsiella aerogenes]HBT3052907.1 hypothetical protein [Klebsiella aerogenes]
MTALIDIGEFSVSDSRDGGQDYLLRPSFEAMTRIGTPAEIVRAYATIHGSDVAKLLEVCTDTLRRIPDWLSPSFNRSAEKVLSTCMHVLQACCEDDMTPMIGEWKGWRHCVVYRPGQMPKNDIIVLAQHLMQHGVVGKAKVRQLQRHETGERTTEFKAFDYISAARSHFGMSRSEASQLTMTEFQMLLAAKYPDQKGFTREEYDAIADDYLAKQAARRAAKIKSENV